MIILMLSSLCRRDDEEGFLSIGDTGAFHFSDDNEALPFDALFAAISRIRIRAFITYFRDSSPPASPRTLAASLSPTFR